MFKTITDQIKRDKDYPERQHRLSVFRRVLDGELYDHLEHGFYEEKTSSDEYIPLRKRRPCVRYNLSKIVVDDSVGLLFSEGHFPDIEADDDAVRDVLPTLVKETKLNDVMTQAAIIGSVGSVFILFRVLNNRVFFTVMETQFITPSWDPAAPDTLSGVTERYKVCGENLIAAGIPVDDDSAVYLYQRDWTDAQEIHYIPLKVSDAQDGVKPLVDITRTVSHNLGFVPGVWIKNLPGGKDVDGACTFKEAIDTQIEIDYQLSQGGRGLKYSSDPTLLIKEPSTNDGSMVKGAANAIIVEEGGDAKLLEINGTATQAVIDYVKFLRECALESVHGNRSNAEKISVAQSGRAMEMMNAALIMLADRLRIPYAEGGLLSLLKMVVKASHKFHLVVDGNKIDPLKEDVKLSLRWPAWYPPTSQDQLTQAQAIQTHVVSGTLSQETGTRIISADYDIEDVEDEREKIKAEKPLESKNPASGPTV